VRFAARLSMIFCMNALCMAALLQAAVAGTTPLPPTTVRIVDWPAEPIAVGAGENSRLVDACGRMPIVLPLTTSSESEVRAGIERERVRVAVPPLPAGEPDRRFRLTALLHPLEQRVVRLDEPGAQVLLADAFRLPFDVRRSPSGACTSVLPQLARRDGNTIAAGTPLEFELGVQATGAYLLMYGPPGLGEARVTRLELPLARSEFDAPFALDQVGIANVRAVEGLPSLVLREAHAAGSEFEWEAPPIPPSGMTWTLLLDVGFAVAALDAAAPPPARTVASPVTADGGAWLDTALGRGIDFVHCEGPELQLDIRPTMGPGLAWGDADGDGWNDLYLAQGAGRAGSRAPLDVLYRNDSGQRFVDVTGPSGIRDEGAGMGVVYVDADGDADLDLYVANYGRDRLYLNDGRAHYTDVTTAVGIRGERWHAGVVAADYDADGDVDVYVTSYLDYDLSKLPPREELAYQRDDPIELLPFAFPGQANTLWRNELEQGALRFVDVAAELGVEDAAGRGMQAVFWDYDGDADLDLYVANDVSPNKLFRNEGAGRFKDVSFSAGVDDPRGSMGLSAEDIDGDLDLDLLVTNWQLEANALYLNNLVSARSRKSHTATFRDAILPARLGPAGIGCTKWGVELFDADLDGDLDLYYANGYTSPDYESTGICVGQPCHYFTQSDGSRFVQHSDGEALCTALAHRALAACDFDQDGDLDLALSANNGRFRLLEYRGARAGHWIGVRLRQSGANPFALGAQVRVRAGGREWLRELRAGTSYLSGNPPELHVGLGAVERIDSIEVRWPDGHRTQHVPEAVDRWITLGAVR
jgi:hypothetical protein